MAVIAVFSVMMFSAQQAFPFYLGNAGTFMLKADSMDINAFELTLGLDDNSSETGGGLPTGELNLGSASVSNLALEKEFNVSSVVGNIAQPVWKLSLTSSSTVNLEATTVNAVGICADSFTATGLTVDAAGANTPDFQDDFSLSTASASLTGVGIEAGFLATNSITLTDMVLTVQPGGYEKAACLP